MMVIPSNVRLYCCLHWECVGCIWV